MRRLTAVFLAVVLFSLVMLPSALAAGKDIYVKGYYRSNGTYVESHYRTAPDKSFTNNYSTYPNVNPYTGQTGTKTYPSTSSYGGYKSTYGTYKW